MRPARWSCARLNDPLKDTSPVPPACLPLAAVQADNTNVAESAAGRLLCSVCPEALLHCLTLHNRITFASKSLFLFGQTVKVWLRQKTAFF